MPTAKQANTLKQTAYASTTPAQFSRVMGVDGKRVRDALRKQGIYVSKGSAFDTKAKDIAFAFANAVIARRQSNESKSK